MEDEDTDAGTGDPEDPEEPEEVAVLPQAPMGPWFWAVMAMIGVLVLMIIYAQVQGVTRPIEVNLTGTTWTLASYADALGTMVPVPGSEVANISFGPAGNGTVTGYAVCTLYSYSSVRNATTISMTNSTLSFCSCSSPGSGDVESLYLRDLANASALRFRSGQLSVADAAGRPLLVFNPAGN